MSLRTGTEHVRVAHALRELPQITAAFAAGRISYSKVRAITRIATPTEQTLHDLALAGTASHVEFVVRATRRLGADPRKAAAQRGLSWSWDEDGSLILRGRLPAAEGAALVAAIEVRSGPPRGPILDDNPDPPQDWHNAGIEQAPGEVADRAAARRADALTTLITEAETAVTTDNAPGATVLRGNTHIIVHFDAATGTAKIDGGPEIPASTAERLACDAHVQLLLSDRSTNRMYLGRRRRLASPAQIAALTIRDKGRCQFAGCTTTHHLSAHHVRHWRHTGPTDVDNLVLLCTFHHGLIHDRSYRIHRYLDHWRTRRPDGTLVPTTGPPLTGSTESLHELHTREQLRITPDTLTPTWGGERLDPTPILMALLHEAA